MLKKSILKKILVFAVLLVLGTASVSFGFPKKAKAAGVSISPSSWTVSPSGSVSVNVNVSSDLEIYAYEIHISGGGALSGGMDDAGGSGGGNSISSGGNFFAVESGVGTITVSGVVSDGSSKDYFSDSIAITVEQPGGEIEENTGGGTGGNAGGGTGGNTGGEIAGGTGGDAGAGTGGNAAGAGWDGTINGVAEQPGSDNANIAFMRVIGPDGQEIPLTDNGNYIWSATVPNSVNKVTVDAAAADARAGVAGTGERELQVGENPIDIVVTAENGVQIGYRINLIRRDEWITVKTLPEELKTYQGDTLAVKLEEGDKLDAALLQTLKSWGKTLQLNKYAEDGSVLYSWSIPCADLPDSMKEFDPAVSFASKNAEEINKLANYADGKYINLAYSGALPKGTTLTLKNADEFKEGALLHLYYYDTKEKRLSPEGEAIKAGKSEVVLPLTHASEFFLTKSDLSLLKAEKKPAPKTDLTKWLVIAGCVVVLGLIVALILVILKRRRGGGHGGGGYRDAFSDDMFERDDRIDEVPDDDFFETGFDEKDDPEAEWEDSPDTLEPYDEKLQEVSRAEDPEGNAEEKVQSLFAEDKPQAAKAGASSVTEVLDFIDYGEEEAGEGGASSLTQALNFIDYGQDETK